MPDTTQVARRLPEGIRRALRKSLEGMARTCPHASGTGRALAEYGVETANLGTSELEAFLKRLPIRRQLTDLAARITEPVTPRLRTLPYPVRLSRKGNFL